MSSNEQTKNSKTIYTAAAATSNYYYRVGQNPGLFLRIYNFAMVSGRNACDNVKILSLLSRKRLQNLHVSAVKCSLSNLHKYSPSLNDRLCIDKGLGNFRKPDNEKKNNNLRKIRCARGPFSVQQTLKQEGINHNLETVILNSRLPDLGRVGYQLWETEANMLVV